MLNELGGAVGGGGSARNAEVEFGPYTSVLSKATALDVAKLAGVASATGPRRLQLPAVRLQQLNDERVNLIGIDPIEGTGFFLHVTVEKRIGDVDQLRHTRED